MSTSVARQPRTVRSAACRSISGPFTNLLGSRTPIVRANTFSGLTYYIKAQIQMWFCYQQLQNTSH